MAAGSSSSDFPPAGEPTTSSQEPRQRLSVPDAGKSCTECLQPNPKTMLEAPVLPGEPTEEYSARAVSRLRYGDWFGLPEPPYDYSRQRTARDRQVNLRGETRKS